MRTINSPGIQITETDLSNYSQPIVGTNVFIAGFAPAGPIDQVTQITSVAEFENVYGTPTTVAEAYFYENCKQVINSPGNLYCTRMPYGSGNGDGFDHQYSALLYPAWLQTNTVTLATSTVVVQSVQMFEGEGVEGINFSAGIETASFVFTSLLDTYVDPTSTDVFTLEGVPVPNSDNTSTLSLSTITVTYTTSQSSQNVVIGKPTQVTLKIEEYNQLVNREFDWDPLQSVASPTDTTPENVVARYSTFNDNKMSDVGFFVLNKGKTAVNERGEGYYINVTDNSSFGPNHAYDSVCHVYGLNGNNVPQDQENSPEPSDYFTDVPANNFTVHLSAASGDKQGSLSHSIDSIPTYNFNSEFYRDAVVVSVIKIASSNYQPDLLVPSVVESYVGSFDEHKKAVAGAGGRQATFFIENVVSQNSGRVQLQVNPNLSNGDAVKWSSNYSPTAGTIASDVTVSVTDDTRSAFALGVYQPRVSDATYKYVGNVPEKLEIALRLIEQVEAYSIDILVDAGLSTIWTNTPDGMEYDDLVDVVKNNVLTQYTPGGSTITDWKSIYDKLETHASTTRRDCIAIVDPLRQIFLHGNTKQAERRNVAFTTAIYTPLKNLLTGIDSNYSAIYGNWARVRSSALNKNIWGPMSGFVAATFARSDSATYPWYAPAGLNRGNIKGAVDLACNPTQKQRDNLYTISVNPVIFFPDSGFVIYGQKTLQQRPTAFDRINVRRLFLALERATAKALKYFVFEPNTVVTRTRLVNTLSPIFQEAKRTQGVYDYAIICNDRNNTNSTIDRNELIVDIYLMPVKAAEFILVNFIATRTGQDFTELM